MIWKIFLTLIILILVFLILCKLIVVLTTGRCASQRTLTNMVVLITGGNRGIGYYTALNLAKRGAKVIITSTQLSQTEAAQRKLILESGNSNIVAKELNFLSLNAVREFAADILRTEPRLDILINNAGAMGHGDNRTTDGLRFVMQINYFGPFLLTHLLMDLLKRSAPSRIVNVGSCLAEYAFFFDPDDLNNTKGPKIANIQDSYEYINSKICMINSTIEMAEKIKKDNVIVNCVHPGLIYTVLWSRRWWARLAAELGKYIFFKSPQEGAETTIHAAVCEKVDNVTGKYYVDCKPSKLWYNVDENTRKKIWQQSIVLCGLRDEEML